MSKTYDLSAILDLPLSALVDYLTYAIEKEQEQAVWNMWISLYPEMVKGYINHKSFDDFKSAALKPVIKVSPKSAEEIEQEMDMIVAKHEGR